MRKYVLALSTIGALLTLGASTGAQASVQTVRPLATPACADNCFNLSSLAYGEHQIQSAVVKGGKGKVGDAVALARATDSSRYEDFTAGVVATVAQLCNASPSQLSPYICNNYGPTSEIKGYFPVYEADW